MHPRIVIAAPKSGSGKTLFSIGLMKAFSIDHKVKAFKCGPDYIDPMFHRTILHIPSSNLDAFFCEENQIQSLFLENNDTDLSIIEGVMGLFDGLGGMSLEASTYHVAKILKAPILLVINTKGMARSVLAEIKGFQSMDHEHLIQGVLLNQVSEMLVPAMKDAIEKECGIPVVGYLPRKKEFEMESRHLGLKLPEEIQELDEKIQFLTKQIQKNVDLEQIYKIACKTEPILNQKEDKLPNYSGLRIGISKDDAFCFWYEENSHILEKMGIELVYFSPLNDIKLPENIDGFILTGGYPENYLDQLESNQTMRNSIKEAIDKGMPSMAECGGFMYLHDSIENQEGNSYSMVGSINGTCRYTGNLTRFGYVHLFNQEKSIKGHSFHYYDSSNNGEDLQVTKPNSSRKWKEGHVGKNHVWSFVHIYYPSNPAFIFDFLESCRKYHE